MPQFTILLFGPAAKAIEADRVFVDGAGSCKGEELKSRIIRQHPSLEQYFQVGRLAVNHGFIAEDTLIDPSDEIALITMVSGG